MKIEYYETGYRSQHIPQDENKIVKSTFELKKDIMPTNSKTDKDTLSLSDEARGVSNVKLKMEQGYYDSIEVLSNVASKLLPHIIDRET